jgi:hypothetical protein
MSDIAIFTPGLEAFLWFALFTIGFALAASAAAFARRGWGGPAVATALSLAAALALLLEDEGVIRLSSETLERLDRWAVAWSLPMALVWWAVNARLSRPSPPGTAPGGGPGHRPRSRPPG